MNTCVAWCSKTTMRMHKVKNKDPQTHSEKKILCGIVLSCPFVPKGPNPLLLHTAKSLYTALLPNITVLSQFERNQQIMGPRRKRGGGSLTVNYDWQKQWTQTYTDICTLQAEHTSGEVGYHPILTRLTWSHLILLYVFSMALHFSHKGSVWKSSNGAQKQANKTKEFKNKHQEDHFIQFNRSNKVASAKKTKKHTANMPGLNTASSPTQEVLGRALKSRSRAQEVF